MKYQHLHSGTPGKVPVSLQRGQLAVNTADKIVFASDLLGNVKPISSGSSGAQNAMSALGVHIPVNFMPVAQLGPGMSQTDLQARFSDDGTTVTYNNIPIFALGRLWWTGTLTSPHSPVGSYAVTLDIGNRTASLGMFTPTSNSGVMNYQTNIITLVVYSDGTISPWFYIPAYSNPGMATLLRISETKTFGAIPVSTGFAGAPATSYWGATS